MEGLLSQSGERGFCAEGRARARALRQRDRSEAAGINRDYVLQDWKGHAKDFIFYLKR